VDESVEQDGTRFIVLRKAQGAAEWPGETNSSVATGGQSPSGATAPRIQFQDLGKVRPFREMQLNPPGETTRAEPPETLVAAAQRVVPPPETDALKAGESLQARTAAQMRGNVSILPPAPRQIEEGLRSAARGPFQPPREEAPRLIINRLDVQVVNQPPAPAVPPTPLPPAEPHPSVESWDNLDRHHLGHVRFML